MLWQRLLFGILMIAALVGIILLDGYLSRDIPSPLSTPPTLTPGQPGANVAAIHPAPSAEQGPPSQPRALCKALVFTLLVALVLILATFEMSRLLAAAGHQPAVLPAAFVAAGLVVIPWMEMQHRLTGMTPLLRLAELGGSPVALWLTVGLLVVMLAVLSREITDRSVSSIATTLLLIAYLGLLGSYVVRIRCLRPGPEGAALAVYFVMTVKCSDIGAYFTGLLMGRHKLAPWVSPAKTIEGAIGGVAIAAAFSVGAMAIWPHLGLGDAPLQLLVAAGFGLIMSVAGQLGDLVESAFKRDVHIKDSGHLVPSFGGILDLIDSLLFTAPIAWCVLTFASPMGYN